MSRHRDVRNIGCSKDYNGYDNVHDHSIGDNYQTSPSNRQFIYNQENSRDQAKIEEIVQTKQDIQEEGNTESVTNLSDEDKLKLESCIEQIIAALGPLSIPRSELVNIVISNNYNVQQATNAILDDSNNIQSEPKQKDVTNSALSIFIAKLKSSKENPKTSFTNTGKTPRNRFNIPSVSQLSSGEGPPSSRTFIVPKLDFTSKYKSDFITVANKKYNKLSDLVSNHLSKSFTNISLVDSCTNVNQLDGNISNLNIVQSKPEVQKSVSEYQVDLTVALKMSPSTQSLPNKSKRKLHEEVFEIPFTDCEGVMIETEKVLETTFDVKDILFASLNNEKPVSSFGKVLCREYRRPSHMKKLNFERNKHLNNVSKIPIFNFDTPSPDDNYRIKYLNIGRRNSCR